MKKYYHWVIAAIISIEMIIFGGFLNAYSIFRIPISDALQVNRATYALANIPYNLLTFFSTMVTNFIFRKTGYKKLAIGSLIVCTMALFLNASCNTIWGYAFARSLFALGYGACFTAGCVWIIKIWFHKHQGFLLGFTSMCTGLGGSFMTSFLSVILEKYDWRVTLQLSGLLFIPIIFLLFLIKDTPKDLGLRPFGENQHLGKQKAKKMMTEWAGFSLQELVRRPSFYLMIINTFLCVIALYMTSPFLVSYLCDSGYSKIEASGYYSILMIVLAVSKLAGGWFSDKFGSKALVYIFVGCTAIAQFMLLDVSNPTTTYIAAVFLGIGASTATVLIPLLTLPLFGYFGSMQINSIMISIPSMSNLISDTVANAIYDISGSYRTYFPVLIGVNIFLLFSYTVLFRFAKKDRKDFEEINSKNTATAK